MRRAWPAVEGALFAAAGVRDRKSVTLYSGCFFPCGDATVFASDDDLGNCVPFCCVGICCVAWCGGKC